MLYYLGKGTEFKKEDCKEYKKLDAALKAAAKDESLVVWDETGKVIGSLTDDIPAVSYTHLKSRPEWTKMQKRTMTTWSKRERSCLQK